MEKMTGHPRLFRRGTRYYHRAAIPVDIKDSYEKTEETFSLKTADYQEAVRRVRVEAARVDRLFEAHRRKLKTETEPLLLELPIDQIRAIGQIYYAHLLEEDEESRLFDGFEQDDKSTILISEADDVDEVVAKYGFRRPSFEQAEQEHADALADNRKDYAKGSIADFFEDEVEEVLAWENINLRLDRQSESWKLVARELQRSTLRANQDIQRRYKGELVDTPDVVDHIVAKPLEAV